MSIEHHKSFLFRNWARTYSAEAQLWLPRSVEELQDIVRLARSTGVQEVRVIGAGHSPSDICCTGDWLVSLKYLNAVIEIDRQNKTFTVQAGRWLYDCHAILREHGLRFSVLGSISEQSIAGAVSTASHGHGWDTPCCSATVLRMVIVKGDGSLVTCSRTENADLFMASSCGLGATGIIVEVTVKCADDTNIEEERFAMETDDYIDAVVGADGKPDTGIFASAPMVRAWWFPQASKVMVQRGRPTPKKDVDAKPSFIRRLIDRLIGSYFHQLGTLCGRFVPSYTMLHARLMWHLYFSPGRLKQAVPLHDNPAWKRVSPIMTRIDIQENICNVECGPRQYTFEVAVPIERAQAALRALQAWLQAEYAKPDGLRHHFPIEMRVMAGDDIWLSPGHAGRVLWIGIIQYKPFGFSVPYKRLFRRFEEITVEHGGRPHWAKAHEMSRHELELRYKHLPKWRETRDAADPKGVFLNAYIWRHLYGRLGEAYDLKRWKTSSPYWAARSV